MKAPLSFHCYADVYRRESGRCHTLPFCLKYPVCVCVCVMIFPQEFMDCQTQGEGNGSNEIKGTVIQESQIGIIFWLVFIAYLPSEK